VLWGARGQSVVKPNNDSFTIGGAEVRRDTEDRFRIDRLSRSLLAAVADGAGGSGLYCGAWAETLVTHLLSRPIADATALDRWMAEFCDGFRRHYAAKAAADSRRRAKFVREGSCATLSACWLAANEDGCTLDWLGFGDSPLLVFDRDADDYAITIWHPRPLAIMDRDPQLLNWKDVAAPAAFHSGRVALPARSTILLASDAVGLYFLAAYVAERGTADQTPSIQAFRREFLQLSERSGGRLGVAAAKRATMPLRGFAEEMSILRNALRSAESFATWVSQRHQAGLLANDDATAVVIDVDIRQRPPPLAPEGGV